MSDIATLATVREHVQSLRRQLDELEDEVRELQGARAQLAGLPTDPKDHGRVGRLETRMDTVEEKQSLHEKALDRLDRIGWKIIVAATLAGTATAFMAKAATWLAR